MEHAGAAQAVVLGAAEAVGAEAGARRVAELDAVVVGDIVAEVRHRRRVERRDPKRVHAERDEVVEAGGYAGQVAYAVGMAVRTGGVLKATWVDLVDDAGLPPLGWEEFVVGHQT